MQNQPDDFNARELLPDPFERRLAQLEIVPNHLPTDSTERKGLPLCTGLLDYFPDALVAVAELSRIGNDKHNPGQPLHWAKEKSSDHADCILRHMVDRGTVDPDDGVRHSAKVAWRALAQLQIEIESEDR